MPVPDDPWIYHITDIGNLAGIARAGALYCKRGIEGQGLEYTNIAYENVQSRRARTEVRVYPGGVLHDYVPFYFCTRSPMLYAIRTGSVPGYGQGETSVVHLVSRVSWIAAAGLRFVFTDGHAIMQVSSFLNDLADLNRVDWSVIDSKSWHDTDEDPDKKRRKQAEFLLHEQVPLSLLRGIGVIDATVAGQIEQILPPTSWSPRIIVRPNWYYG